jgi:uncharacterized membrane protein
MNPFDLKSALLAKHAQHVVLIHFPIALFLMGTCFDFLAGWSREVTRKTTLAAAARLNILAAAVFVAPTLITGILAWQWQLEGGKLKGLLLLHLVLGCVVGFLICLAAWIHFRQRDSTPGYCRVLEVFTAVLITITAHAGGFLSGVNIAG